MFKTPEVRKSFTTGEPEEPPVVRRGRSSEDFLMFCKMILDYENYDPDDSQQTRQRHTSSPMGSTGSVGESNLSTSGSSGLGSPLNTLQEHAVSDDDSEDDSEGITCYCKKPYAGRPMIECSSCGTWVHLACARVKRTNIPDIWFCAICKSKTSTKGASRGTKVRARRAKSRKQNISPSEAVLNGPRPTPQQTNKRKS